MLNNTTHENFGRTVGIATYDSPKSPAGDGGASLFECGLENPILYARCRQCGEGGIDPGGHTCSRIHTFLRNLWHWRTAWAVRHLSKQLRNDPYFRQSWQSNIAMPIYDATRPQCLHQCETSLDRSEPHCELRDSRCEINQACTIPRRFECREMSIEQANYIADRLMKHLFGA